MWEQKIKSRITILEELKLMIDANPKEAKEIIDNIIESHRNVLKLKLDHLDIEIKNSELKLTNNGLIGNIKGKVKLKKKDKMPKKEKEKYMDDREFREYSRQMLIGILIIKDFRSCSKDILLTLQEDLIALLNKCIKRA